MDNYKITYLSIALTLFALFLEYIMPSGTYISAGYILGVIVTIYAKDKAEVVFSAVVASIAIFGAVFLLHPNQEYYTSAINHSFTLMGVVAAMFFVLYVKQIQLKAERDTLQLESLFSNATEGIILSNKAGEIELINPFAEKMFGYDEGELIGKKIEVLIPRTIHARHEKYREGFHDNPVNRPMGAGRDLYALKKSGDVFPVEISLSHYKVGRESYVTAFIIDITVRKRQYEEIERVSREVRELNIALEQKVKDRTVVLHETLSQLEVSKDELAKALEKEKEVSDLKSRFVSTVSHEFRTPLSTILTSASLIKSYVNDEMKRQRHVHRIEESVTHMNAMLEDLLSLGKLEEGLIEVRRDIFDIAEFLGNLTQEMAETTKRKNPILYSFEGIKDVNTDKRLVKNILINLISNAVKFSEAGKPVSVVAKANQELITISVTDAGIGISEEDQKHLFTRFFRGQNAANIKGTGLGLHIVTKYLELLDGSISLSSKLDEGTTFTITIQNAPVV